MVETIDFTKIYTEDIDFGTDSREIRLQNGALVSLQQFDPGWELASRTGELHSYLGRGRTILIDRAVEVSRDITINDDETLLFTDGGYLLGSGDITVNGVILAGPTYIFQGSGTVSGNPRILHAYPEWFGARGDGETYDHEAWQKTLDFFPKVRGRDTAQYLMNVMALQWSTLDLHRQAFIGGTPVFDEGFWVAVRCPNHTEISYANFVLNFPTTNNERQHHCFGFGDRTSATRYTECSLEHCTFRRHASHTQNTNGSYHTAIVQSVDGFRYAHNIYDDTNGLDERTIGLTLLDCHSSALEHNYYVNVTTFVLAEYCEDTFISHNRFWNCHQIYDWDKLCNGLVVLGNTFDRETQDQTFADACCETNGGTNVTIMGNVVRNARKGVSHSVKDNLYPTFAAVLAQSGSATVGLWNGVKQIGNIWRDLHQQALIIGGSWVTNPHVGYPPGDAVEIRDTFLDCGSGLSGDNVGVIYIQEGTGIHLDVVIKGSGACGIHARSQMDDDAVGATADSNLEIEYLGGRIEECRSVGVFINKASRVHIRNLYMAENGEDAASPAQMRINRMEARNAIITMDATRIYTRGGTINKGIDTIAQDMTAGVFRCELSHVHVSGHGQYDFHVNGDSTTERLDNYRFTMCHFDLTSFNTAQPNFGVTMPLLLTSPLALPSGSAGDDVSIPAGAIILNTTVGAGYPFGWQQISTGTPGFVSPIATLAGAIAKTANETLTRVQSGQRYSNAGAAGTITLTLPVAVAGLAFSAIRIASQAFRLDPDGTEVIRGGGAGKYLEMGSNGANVTIQCVTTGIWDIFGSFGTITYEP